MMRFPIVVAGYGNPIRAVLHAQYLELRSTANRKEKSGRNGQNEDQN
jgi:hypothetical protein